MLPNYSLNRDSLYYRSVREYGTDPGFDTYDGRFLPTQGPIGPTISGFRSWMVFAPMFRIVFVISSWKTVVLLA